MDATSSPAPTSAPATMLAPNSAKVTTGTGASPWRTWGSRVVMGLVLLVLLAAAAYGGYAWEHARAVSTEQSLNSKIAKLQHQLSTSRPSGQTTVNTSTPACTAGDLTLAQVTTRGAAGTMGIIYSVTNTSSADCTVSGYPVVTLADSGGQKLGKAAEVSGVVPDTTITLQHNEKAYVTVLFPDAANFAAGVCSAAEAAMIKLTPSGQSAALQTSISGEHYCPGFTTQAFTSTAP